MKILKFIIRLLVSPFVLGVISVSFIIGILDRWLFFIWNGGEFIVYKKNENRTINDIYKILKKEHNEHQKTKQQHQGSKEIPEESKSFKEKK